MTTCRAPLYLLAVAVLGAGALGACGGRRAGDSSARDAATDSAADPYLAKCNAVLALPQVCTDACRAARNNVSTSSTSPCAAASATLAADAELPTYASCISGCPSALTCEFDGGVAGYLSCECTAACIAARSATFRSDVHDLYDCVDTNAASACE